MKSSSLGEVGLALLRMVLGLLMLYFGAQKALGLFGGLGLAAAVEDMHLAYGIPALAAYLAIAAQLAGGLGLVLGLLTRFAAFGVACTMGLAFAIHARSYAMWDALAAGRNEETALLVSALCLLTMALCTMLAGPGRWALDARLFGKERKKREAK